ncbi:FAD-dependent 5-carboxymethylaminomethyl-2-thiouridine(34) oxidoreductase MnmC [Kingella potus]|uniref:FAD-dependent 5-carboxymethylaminomethyl-2-thiouridine(34) oxidoreductase MnmC n=1 Tax=Kingella potus TaxID=265175 RepID=UPI001FD16270|nr:FAD-dependent 5-carboxymethylaminomethyl-2-thiouridine(34) oxidoreductase MnmC [Kingella potus]UOP01806.1 FAD-dependent 5-carboxymethylaminomethyl-2-thiouridine(34) oxidoreductase MnmC [Kingella potus]
MTAVWNAPPPLAGLVRAAGRHRVLAVCLPDLRLPEFAASATPCETERRFLERWPQQSACVQFAAPNILHGLLPGCALWLMPPVCAARLHEHFSDGLQWQTEPVPQTAAAPQKPWYRPSENAGGKPPQHVAVVGAGIAGAATAYALAVRGVRVTVLEAAAAAHAASGNRQGLLYAKISAHDTAQTELLLGGYGHSRRLLDALLPERENWQPCGLLHLNHNPAEARRNAGLAMQTHHSHLYRGVSVHEAGKIAGIDVYSDGLYWPQGAWLHPPALVRALLAHPNITLHEHTPLLAAQWQDGAWRLQTPAHSFSAAHIVYCTGADSPRLPALSDLPWQLIRGQTGLAAATAYTGRLKTALSAACYISPAWQGLHCYGASFTPHDSGSGWREADEEHNRRELLRLHPQLAAELAASPAGAGHAAVRCDSPDHLPCVYRLADYAAMKRLYAKLAHDKNYPLHDSCPYLPNAWVNAAHGSRALATAPWCAEQLAAEILGLPQPFSRRLREALHPNRHIVRAIVRSHEAGQGVSPFGK